MTIPTAERVLTLDQAARLGDLIRAVERNAKMDWYQRGSLDCDRPVRVELRCFTHGTGPGQATPDGQDVRDLHVWTTGKIAEHWFTVPELLDALRNAHDAFKGMDAPMAAFESVIPPRLGR